MFCDVLNRMSNSFLSLLKQVLTGRLLGKARHAAVGGGLSSHQLSLHPFYLDKHEKKIHDI